MTKTVPPLGAAVRRGVGTTTFVSIVQVLCQLGSVAVLSRLLEPADFGIVAAPLALAGILSLLTEFGMGSNIVQRKAQDLATLGTALFVVLALGLTGTAAMLSLSMPLSTVLGQGGTAWAFALAAPLLVLTPLATHFESLCLRDLDYGGVLWSNLASATAQTVLPIALALMGAGAVVLVLAQLVIPLARIAVLAPRVPLPRPRPDWAILRDMTHFSAWFTLTRVFSMIALNGDRLVLSTQIPPAALGYYVRAQNFAQILITLLGTSLEKVLFPLLAALSDERDRMAAFYLDTLRLLGLVTGLAALAAMLFADWLVYMLLGPGWAQAVPIAQIFSAMIFLRAMDKAAAMLMRNHRMVRERALLQAAFAIVTVGAALAFGSIDLRLVALTIVGGAVLGAAYSIVMTALYLKIPLRRAAAPMLVSLGCIAACAGTYVIVLPLLPLAEVPARLAAFALASVIVLCGVWLLRRPLLGPRLATLLSLPSRQI